MAATYRDIVEKAIEKEKGVIGEEKAIKVAKDSQKIEVDSKGRVKNIIGDEKKAVDELVRKYQQFAGKIAASMIAREIEDMDLSNIDLPDVLNDKISSSKAEEFASAF